MPRLRTVTKNLAEGALLVIAVLFRIAGQSTCGADYHDGHSRGDAHDRDGDVAGPHQRQSDEPGARWDFGLIVDGAVIIAENSLRRLAERQRALGRELALNERLTTVRSAAGEMVAPNVYGQAIIILVYVPLLTFSGVEGKMFEPMALTVIMALVAAFVLSMTLVPALIAIFVTGRIREQENVAMRSLKRLYAPASQCCCPLPNACDRRCGSFVRKWR